MISLTVLGALRIKSDAPSVVDELVGQPKALAVLVYLALARPRGYHQRDRLVGLFWPERDQAHARAALRKLIHRLRVIIGDDVIDSQGNESIAIVAGAVGCDAVSFCEAIQDDRLSEALDLYVGELLPGFFISGAGEFERWLEAERAYYHETAVATAWELVQRYANESALTNASHLARYVARLTPTDERMLRKVMRMLEQLGDRAGVMEVYSKFVARLMRDFGITPSSETQRLADDIRRGLLPPLRDSR